MALFDSQFESESDLENQSLLQLNHIKSSVQEFGANVLSPTSKLIQKACTSNSSRTPITICWSTGMYGRPCLVETCLCWAITASPRSTPRRTIYNAASFMR